MKHPLRTRIKKDIVSEFVPPSVRTSDVIILCSGMPGYPAQSELMFLLAKLGYWVFLPRYRGSWESGGSLLKISPHEDILDLIDSLSDGFMSIWDGKVYKINNPKVRIIGSSFGGPAAILASTHKNVKKVVALSPVIDWRIESETEPLNKLKDFTLGAFGNGYRVNIKDWNKLKSGSFYNPISVVGSLNKKKIYVIHAKDDDVVYPSGSILFAEKLGCSFTLLKSGGHLSLSDIWRNASMRKKVLEFLG